MAWIHPQDFDKAAEALSGTPAAPYAKALTDWRDTLDQNPDGWFGWRSGARAADALVALVAQAWNAACPTRSREAGRMPGETEFENALTPIRQLAAHHFIRVPALG